MPTYPDWPPPSRRDSMEQRARIRVDLAQRAFEIEGSETFVRELLDRLEDLV